MTLSDFESFFGKTAKLNYVGCDGKQRITKETFDKKGALKFIKNSEIMTRNNKSIGVIVPKGYVVVDIDEGKDAAKAVIKDLGIKTLILETKKGLHCFFKTRKNLERKIKILTPFGIKCDLLTAEKSYVILPPNNPNRKVYMKEPICSLPDKMQPLQGQKQSLFGLCEGDGRNDRLLSVLSSYAKKNPKANEDDFKLLAKLINKHVFADPLPEKELYFMLGSIDKYKLSDAKYTHVKYRDIDSSINALGMDIERLDSEGKNRFLIYNEKGKPVDIDHLNIADLLVESKRVCVVHNDIYMWKDGIYSEAGKEIRDLIKTLAGVTTVTKQSKVMEVYKSILDDVRLQAKPSDFDTDENLINFNNGVWDIQRGELLPHDPKYKFMHQIPHRLRKPIKDKFLFENKSYLRRFFKKTKISEENQEMILDFMAYTLTKNNNLRAFLALVGVGGTGKSALISFIQGLIGDENTSALSLHDVGKRFMAATLEGKLLNVCADNDTKALYQIDTIKRLTGGDTLMCEYKGRDPYPFTPYAKLCFSFNQMPRQLEEKSDAFYDRMRVVRMNNKIILDEKFVANFYGEAEYERVLWELVHRLPIKKIRKSEESLEEAKLARKRSDSVFDYLDEEFIRDEDKYCEKEFMFERYVAYCRKLGRNPHAYYLFFDYVFDYPDLTEVEIYDKSVGIYKKYIKGIQYKRRTYVDPEGLNMKPKDIKIKTDKEFRKELEQDWADLRAEKIQKDIENANKKRFFEESHRRRVEREEAQKAVGKFGVKMPITIDFSRVNAKSIVFAFDFRGIKEPKKTKERKKVKKATKPKKSIIFEFNFKGVRKPMIYEFNFKDVRKPIIFDFDFSQVKYPRIIRVREKYFIINFEGISGKAPRSLVYQFDFSSLRRKNGNGKRRGIKGNYRVRE